MSLSRASVHHDETRGKSTRGVVRFGARQMVRLRATRKTATNNANPMGQSCGVAIITSHHRAEESALDGGAKKLLPIKKTRETSCVLRPSTDNSHSKQFIIK
jgi:hypothetical protein